MENILRFNGGLSSSQIVQQLDKLFPVNKEKGKLDGLNKKG